MAKPHCSNLRIITAAFSCAQTFHSFMVGYVSYLPDLLCVGDDKGRVYMYNLKKVVKQKKTSDEILRPSRVSS